MTTVVNKLKSKPLHPHACTHWHTRWYVEHTPMGTQWCVEHNHTHAHTGTYNDVWSIVTSALTPPPYHGSRSPLENTMFELAFISVDKQNITIANKHLEHFRQTWCLHFVVDIIIRHIIAYFLYTHKYAHTWWRYTECIKVLFQDRGECWTACFMYLYECVCMHKLTGAPYVHQHVHTPVYFLCACGCKYDNASWALSFYSCLLLISRYMKANIFWENEWLQFSMYYRNVSWCW